MSHSSLISVSNKKIQKSSKFFSFFLFSSFNARNNIGNDLSLKYLFLNFFERYRFQLSGSTLNHPGSGTKSNTRSVHKNSPVSETVLSLDPFFRNQVFTSQIKTKEEIFWATSPLKGPALSLPSFVQIQTPDQCIKTVQCPKQFYLLFGGPSLCITDQD